MSKLISTAKRYEPDMDLPYANMFEKTDGDYVSYADYAAQAARIEQLTAENLALKNFIKDECYTRNRYAHELYDASISMPVTSATDAALREIQVQVWRDALVLAKSAISTDSQDHIDFLFNGKVEQVLAGEVQL